MQNNTPPTTVYKDTETRFLHRQYKLTGIGGIQKMTVGLGGEGRE